MSESQNLWDGLTGCFSSVGEDATGHGLRNALLLWPAIAAIIQRFACGSKLRVLDYGCGTGGLSRLLSRAGHKVTAIDPSEAMVMAARKEGGEAEIEMLIGDYGTLSGRDSFDVIAASMVFQFIEDAQSSFSGLAALQQPGNILVLVTHNPEYVRTSIESGKNVFSGFASGVPGGGFLNIDGTNVPLFVRESAWYQEQSFSSYELLQTGYPEYSKEYLAQFPDELISVPRCEILVWRRL